MRWNSFRAQFIGALSFIRCLFRPMEPISKYSEQGHKVLKGWPFSPEERIFFRANHAARERQNPFACALFGLAGPHKGDLIPLRRSVESLGTSVTHTIAVTPADIEAAQSVRLYLKDGVRIQAEPGQSIAINGCPIQEGPLLEFDEISVAGNTFLYLKSDELGAEVGGVA